MNQLPHLKQAAFGHAQQVGCIAKLPEEFCGDVPKANSLQPVQDEVQVGSDLHRLGPLEERLGATWKWVVGGRQGERVGKPG